jgi:amidase
MASTDLDLCFMTATEAIAKFRSKELSPVDVMQALVARSEEVNRKLNVLTYAFYDRALEQAKRAEATCAGSGKGKEPRPLEGVAVAIKDFHSVAGEIATYRSKIFEGERIQESLPPGEIVR